VIFFCSLARALKRVFSAGLLLASNGFAGSGAWDGAAAPAGGIAPASSVAADAAPGRVLVGACP
jgi:hypothetical protein